MAIHVGSKLSIGTDEMAMSNGLKLLFGTAAVHFVLLIQFSLALHVTKPQWHGPYEVTLAATLLGLTFGQTLLAGFWAAFSSASWYLRLAVGLGMVFVSWIAGFVSLPSDVPAGDVGTPGAAMLLEFFVALLLLAGVRFSLKCRLSRPRTDEPDSQPTGPLQFGIKHLLITLTVASVVLAIGRLVVGADILHGEFMAFGLFLTFNVVLLTPVALAMLIERGALLAVIASGAWAAALTPLETRTFEACGFGGQEPWFFQAVNGMLWLALVLSLLAPRICGWRLVKRLGAAAPAAN